MSTITNIIQILESRGLTPYELCKGTKISTGNFTDWKNGKSNPSLKSIQKIADYLHLQITDLTDSESTQLNKKTENVTFDDFTYALYNESKDLTDEQKKMLLDMARMLRERQHHEGKDKQ